MGRRLDNRAVAVPVAAVLALGFLILGLTVYQATVVPAETAEVEHEHSTTISSQFAGLADSIETTASDGSTTPSTIRLGVQYPFRTFVVGPSQSGGTVETAPLGTVQLENASYPNTANPDRVYATSGIRYTPTYSQYDVGAETWLEHGVAVRRADSGSAVGFSEQYLIDGSQLSLPVLNGSLSRSGSDRTTVPNRPVSVSETTVEVRPNESGPLTLVAPTRLDEPTWNRLLAAERTPDGQITDITVTDQAGTDTDELRITLANGSYDLDVASIGVTDRVEDPEPAYLFERTQDQTVRAGMTVPVSVEVRDRYDNPTSGVRVDFSADGDELGTVQSDERGIATYEYTVSGSDTVDITAETADPESSVESVAIRLRIA